TNSQRYRCRRDLGWESTAESYSAESHACPDPGPSPVRTRVASTFVRRRSRSSESSRRWSRPLCHREATELSPAALRLVVGLRVFAGSPYIYSAREGSHGR